MAGLIVAKFHPGCGGGSSATRTASSASGEYQRITIGENVRGVQVVTINDSSLGEDKVCNELENNLERFINEGHGRIVLNLSNVQDLSSTGLRILIIFKKKDERKWTTICLLLSTTTT